MRFYLHGTTDAALPSALAKHDHAAHTFSDFGDAIAEEPQSPQQLLPLLAKRQWDLLTTDTAFIRDLYEHKISFQGTIIQILSDPDAPKPDYVQAIDRLFDRYKRLSPRRLYTITASRVKIRQLPGGHE